MSKKIRKQPQQRQTISVETDKSKIGNILTKERANIMTKNKRTKQGQQPKPSTIQKSESKSDIELILEMENHVKDYDWYVESVESRCAWSDISRSDIPATKIYAALRDAKYLSLPLVRKIVKAAREHHTEWDRCVVFGTPHVLSICPYKGSGPKSLAFIFGYKYPYLTPRKIYQRISKYDGTPISLDEVRKIHQEAMEARKESERAGLFKVSKEARASYWGE